MKFRYLVHTGFADEEFEIMADGYDIEASGGFDHSVRFYAASLFDGFLPARTTVLLQSIAPGYWIQTLNFGMERIERTNNNGK